MDKRPSAAVCSVVLLCCAVGAVSPENAVARTQSRSAVRDASSVSLVQTGETIAFGVPLADYRRNIAEILDRCAASGVKVILMTPTMTSKDPDDVRNIELEQYCGWLREIATQRKL